ncbi:MAG: tetratricopeptide repeat protein [Stigonema ocellatum SAG 48.90 = DSM 106950]|nr:tetratricopeptide repeat protein [Stigonema ocellatum SAG 48.90 = DSM 106950]
MEISIPFDRLACHLEQDPSNLALRIEAICSACQAEQWATARQLVEHGLTGSPDSPALRALSGVIHLQSKQYGLAIEQFSLALDAAPSDPDIRLNLSTALFLEAQYAQSLEHLCDSSWFTALPAAWTLRARCLHHLGRMEEAISDCMARLRRDPSDAETLGVMALAWVDLGNVELALQNAAHALELDPRQPEALLASASAHSMMQDYARARAALEVLLTVDANCGRGWMCLALVETECFRLEAAKLAIANALRHLPQHIGAWHTHGWLLLMTREVDAAAQAFDQALQLDRTFAETRGAIAVIHVLQGHEVQARGEIKRALRLDTNCSAARYAELLLMLRHGQHEEAKELLNAYLSRPIGTSGLYYRDVVPLHLAAMQERQLIPLHGLAVH